MKCKHCGRTLDPDSQFCKYCGSRRARPATGQRPVESQPHREISDDEPTTWFAAEQNARVAAQNHQTEQDAPHKSQAMPRPRSSQRPPEPHTKPSDKLYIQDEPMIRKAPASAQTAQLPKWIIPAICIAAVALLLTGVLVMLGGKQPSDPTQEVILETTLPIETEATTEAPSETETEPETEPPTTEPVFECDADWAQAYYDQILSFEKAHKDINADRGLKYRLLYIDDNEVPELYMQAGDANALYTYEDDETVKIYEAKSADDEKLVGVRTRRGVYFSSRINEDGERYAVNALKDGKVTETETYRASGDEYTINGSSVDLVEFTQYVRAKQANYQLTDIPIYTKAELLDAMQDAAESEELPEMASEEAPIDIPDHEEDEDEEDEDGEETGEKRFEVFAGDVTWSQAQARCKEKGGHLAYIKSESDWNAVMDAIKKADSGLSYLWVGGQTTIGSDGKTVTAKWSDGSSTSYLDSAKLWFGHEPSGKDGSTLEPYMMLWNPGSGWSFNDNSDSCVGIYASGTIGYVCQFTE